MILFVIVGRERSFGIGEPVAWLWLVFRIPLIPCSVVFFSMKL